eukprot:3731088-Ditylum_brightwellii.AAC.2
MKKKLFKLYAEESNSIAPTFGQKGGEMQIFALCPICASTTKVSTVWKEGLVDSLYNFTKHYDEHCMQQPGQGK